MAPSHILLAVAVMAAWGFNFVVVKFGLDSFPPILLSALRFGLAGLPLIFLWKSPPAPIKWIVAIALCLAIFKFSLLFIGMNLGAGPGVSSLVLQMQAFFTVLLAIVFMGDRPSLRQYTGILLAFVGLGIVIEEKSAQAGAYIGLTFVVASAFCWGLSNIAMKKAQSNNPLHLIIWISGLSAPFLFGLSWVFEDWTTTDVNLTGIGSVLYLSIIATLAGFGTWAYLLKTYDASQVAPFTLLVPIFGMSSAALIVGETISQQVLIAACFILVGLYLNTVQHDFFRRKITSC